MTAVRPDPGHPVPLAPVVPVLVVGAGPVGVTAAALLAGRGVPSLVVDRHQDVYPLPRAVHLDDEVLRVLHGLLGAGALDELTTPARGLRLLDADHRTIAVFRRDHAAGVHGYPQANMFDQPHLERMLRDGVRDLDEVTLTGGVELVTLEQDQPPGAPAPVRATLRRLDDGAQQQVFAHAVLGCDGANSTVRDLIGSRLLDLRFEERWLVVDVRTDRHLETWDGVDQVCDPRRPATFMRVAPGRYRWEFRLHDGETAADLLEPDRLSQLLRPWTKDISHDELEVLRSAEYTFKARIAGTWRDRRVFLLGDAAHLTPPFIGQGLCAGLRDAANLTWKLAGVLQGTLDEVALGTYESERAPHARAVVKKAVTVGRVMTGGQDGTALIRRVVLGGLCRVPGFTTRVLDAEMPRLTPGPLVTPGRWSLTGRLVPQPWVTVDGRRRRLDDVLGAGFSILTLDVPGPSLQRAARRLDARIVRVVSVPGPAVTTEHVVTAVDDDGVLASWLRSRRAVAVVARPDRVVLAQTSRRDGGAGLAADITSWTWAVVPPAASRLPAAQAPVPTASGVTLPAGQSLGESAPPPPSIPNGAPL
jgi:3-(3-hydroxy-phenyl)propionate hydroxylase